jgi:hypothetical protein
VTGFLKLDVVIAGMAVDDGELKGIIGSFCHYAFIEVVDVAFFYFWVVVCGVRGEKGRDVFKWIFLDF